MTLPKSGSEAAHRSSQEGSIHEIGPRPRFVLVIAILLALQITDGIDQAALSFTAPFVRKELGVGIESLGAAFSAGFIGTAVGAVLFGTLADFIRKKMPCSSR